jgi:hypothetical protein
MNGHHYIEFVNVDGERVEFAIPARIDSTTAIALCQVVMPGWFQSSITWRAAFDQRDLPANSSPGYQSGVHPPAAKAA